MDKNGNYGVGIVQLVVRFFLKEDRSILTSPSMTSSSDWVAQRHKVATKGSVHACKSGSAHFRCSCYGRK